MVILNVALFFAKSTILLFYVRVFGIRNIIRYGAWFGIFLTFGLYWSAIPVNVITAAPRAGQPWSVEIIYRRHEIATLYSLYQGALAVALDVYIFFLPIPIVMTLQMTLKRRLSVLIVFGTAVL